MVANLADNAAQHARSRVALSLGEDGSTVRLSVDDGTRDRRRIANEFERFVRLDAARSRDDGAASAWRSSRSWVAHRGSVTVAAGRLGGARVDVVLPR